MSQITHDLQDELVEVIGNNITDIELLGGPAHQSRINTNNHRSVALEIWSLNKVRGRSQGTVPYKREFWYYGQHFYNNSSMQSTCQQQIINFQNFNNPKNWTHCHFQLNGLNGLNEGWWWRGREVEDGVGRHGNSVLGMTWNCLVCILSGLFLGICGGTWFGANV